MSLRLSATERVRKSESIESGLTQFGLGVFMSLVDHRKAAILIL